MPAGVSGESNAEQFCGEKPEKAPGATVCGDRL